MPYYHRTDVYMLPFLFNIMSILLGIRNEINVFIACLSYTYFIKSINIK